VTEADGWLRAGNWKGWKNDQFLGVDVHHATLGIIAWPDRPGDRAAREGFSIAFSTTTAGACRRRSKRRSPQGM